VVCNPKVQASGTVEVEGGKGEKEERARPGLQYGEAREVPGEEGEEDPGKFQEDQEEKPAFPRVGGPPPWGQVERGEGPSKLYLVEDSGKAVAHHSEAPRPVDLHLKAAEGVAQNLTPDFPVDLGFPFRKEGSGGRFGFLTSNLSIPSSHKLTIAQGRPSTTLSNPLEWDLLR
jgi:hypothetical protein